jgi:hypothetical protein
MRPFRGTSQDRVTEIKLAIANTREQFDEVLTSGLSWQGKIISSQTHTNIETVLPDQVIPRREVDLIISKRSAKNTKGVFQYICYNSSALIIHWQGKNRCEICHRCI